MLSLLQLTNHSPVEVVAQEERPEAVQSAHQVRLAWALLAAILRALVDKLAVPLLDDHTRAWRHQVSGQLACFWSALLRLTEEIW